MPDFDLSAAIRAERERLGLTIQQAADRLGVAKQTYAQWEPNATRVSQPSAEGLYRLKRAGFDLRKIAPELFADASTPRRKSRA